MKPRVVLHIGHSKTGTSTIQAALSRHRRELLAHAVLYPQTGWQGDAHHPIAHCFLAGERRVPWVSQTDPAALRRGLEAEIAAALPMCVLISSEMFCIAQPPRVRAWLGQTEATVLAMLRRQDLWVDSLYQQQLKRGRTDLAFEAWLAPRANSLDYERLLRPWARVFGRGAIRVGVFESQRMPQGLMRYFLDTAEIGHAPDLPDPPPQNERLSRPALEYLLRRMREGLAETHRPTLRALLERYSREHPDPPQWRSFLSPQRRRELLAGCEKSNAAVARAYLGAERLFEEPGPDLPFEPYPGLDAASEASIRDYVAAQPEAAALPVPA